MSLIPNDLWFTVSIFILSFIKTMATMGWSRLHHYQIGKAQIIINKWRSMATAGEIRHPLVSPPL